MSERERERRRARDRQRDKLRNLGRPARVTDEEFARVKALLAKAHAYGMSDRMIARQVGLDWKVPWRVRTGYSKRVWRATYEKLMTLRPEEPNFRSHPSRTKIPQGFRVPAVGVQRRLRALRADGFTSDWIASELGVTPDAVSKLAADFRGFVFASTHSDVDALYRKTGAFRPADVGITVSASRRAMTWAKRYGWVSRSCWDEGTIDDPGALPDWTGVCGTPFGPLQHKLDEVPLCGRCADVSPAVFSGTKLRECRELAGLSQNDLSRCAGISSGVIHHYELGRYAPRLPVAAKIMNFLDVTLEELYESEET